MNILIVSQYFWPENFLINDAAKELVKRGHNVTVLTGWPNYPQGKIYKDFSDDPKDFQNYQGADIVRVPVMPRGQGTWRLMLNYFSFAFFSCVLVLGCCVTKE